MAQSSLVLSLWIFAHLEPLLQLLQVCLTCAQHRVKRIAMELLQRPLARLSHPTISGAAAKRIEEHWFMHQNRPLILTPSLINQPCDPLPT